MAEEKSKKESGKTEENKKRHEEPPFLEWVVAALGLILVVAAVGFMLYEAVTEESKPPNFTINVDSVTPAAAAAAGDGGGYIVRFRVRNTGDRTAADVLVEGELTRGSESAETNQVTLSYVPSNSEREAGFIFTKNPHEHELKIRARSYEKP